MTRSLLDIRMTVNEQRLALVDELVRHVAVDAFGAEASGPRVAAILRKLLDNLLTTMVGDQCRISVSQSGAEVEVAVESEHRQAEIRLLREELDHLGRQEPLNAVLDALSREPGLALGQVGLALARLRFENQVELEARATGGHRMRVSARGPAAR